ncbi:MAG TPA: pit accessory protein [Verrucomicrobiae bacterium]|jgi:uncharacterized protein Yka (UPF0111/DUF47 family)|nr:pit accessory protein [Verrucomicrobiae bacterium]
MFSLQRMLGRDDEFCALLEGSAQQAVNSVGALKGILQSAFHQSSLDAFAAARRNDKQITAQIAELLVRALVTSLEREDIESLAEALYKIPKTVEKFAERYLLTIDHVRDFEFTRQLVLLEEGVRSVLEMVQAFRAGAGVAEITRLDARIQRLEREADQVSLEMVQRLYQPGFPTVRGIALKDLIELNEKAVDRCRDASTVIARVVIKRY